MPLRCLRHGGTCKAGRKYMSVDDQKYGCHNKEAFDDGSDGLFHFFWFSFHLLRREPWELSGRMLYFNCLRLNCVQCLYRYHIIGQGRMQEEVVTISLHHIFTLPSPDPFLFHLLCRKAGISFLQISAFLFLCPAGSVHLAKKKTDAHRVPGGNRSASV